MADERTKHVGTLLTVAQHAAFKIACVKLGTTMDKCIHDAVTETITIASLMPAGGGLAREGDGDG